MQSGIRRTLLAALCGVAIGAPSIAARAEATSENPAPVTTAELPSAPNAATCSDEDTAAAARKREAALVELGRRLSAEPQPDGDYQVLNRTGHNYGSRAANR